MVITEKWKIRYTIDAEGMYCPKEKHITLHVITGGFWTCIDCGHQLGKDLSKYKKLLKKLFK